MDGNQKPLEATSKYDLPTLYLTQLLDGELQDTIFRNLFSPNRLTPDERDMFKDTLKKQVATDTGGDTFSDWAVDMLTNPFVWMAVLFPAAGSKTLAKGMSMYQKIPGSGIGEKAGVIKSIGLLSGFEMLRDYSSVTEAMIAMEGVVSSRLLRNVKIIGQAEEDLLTFLQSKNKRIKSLDPAQVSDPEAKKMVKEVMNAIHIRMDSMDKTFTQKHMTGKTPQVSERIYRTEKLDYPDAGTGLVRGEEIERNVLKGNISGDGAGLAANKRLQEIKEAHRKHERDYLSLGKKNSKGEVEDIDRAGRHIYVAKDKKGDSYVHVFETIEARASEVISKEQKAIYSSSKVDKVLSKYPPAEQYIQKNQQALADNFMANYGNDSFVQGFLKSNPKLTNEEAAINIMNQVRAGKIPMKDVLDTDKVYRLYQSRFRLNDPGRDTKLGPTDFSKGDLSLAERYLSNMFGSGIEGMMAGVKNRAGFDSKVTEIFETQILSRDYFPRAASIQVDHLGNIEQNIDNVVSSMAKSAALDTDRHVLQRTRTHRLMPMSFYNETESLRVAVEKGKRNAFNEQVNHLQLSLKQAKDTGVALKVSNPNVNRTLSKYYNEASHTHALYTAGTARDASGRFVLDPKVWAHVIDAQKRTIGTMTKAQREMRVKELPATDEGMKRAWGAEGDVTLGLKAGTDFESVILKGETVPVGGFSLSDIVEQGYTVADPHTQEAIREVLLPRMLGRRTLDHAAGGSLTTTLKKFASDFTKTPVANVIKKTGGIGKKLVEDFETFGSAENLYVNRGSLSGNTAKYLYATHLGYNPASVLLNLFQPLITTSNTVGMDNVLKAYGQAFQELGAYAKNRTRKHGFKLRLSADEKEELIKESFRFAKDPSQDVIGIGPNLFDNVDALIVKSHDRPSSLMSYSLTELPLKAFEKAEWLNRLVSSHATHNAYRQAAKGGALPLGELVEGTQLWRQMQRDSRDIVNQTQFGSGFMNTPLLFMEGFGSTKSFRPSGRVASTVLSNPTMRQFLSFPTRFFTGATYVPRQVGGGKRFIRGGKEFNAGPGLSSLIDLGRGLGISSAVYYTIKDFTGADPSRALYADAIMDFPKIALATIGVGDNPKGLGFQPPIVSMGVDLSKWVFGGDKEAMGRTMSRSLPGGIAFSRALGVSPRAKGVVGGLAQSMQKSYANWDNPNAEGKIPVFKGDGTFIQHASPVELIMSGAGMDMGKFSKEKGNIESYFLAQTDEMRKYNRDILASIRGNNMAKAKSSIMEFEKRFKVPYRISKDRLRSFVANSTIARPERMLDRLPPDVRSQYAGFVAESGRSGLPPEAFNLDKFPTATKRSEVYDRPKMNMDPEAISFLRNLLEEKDNIEKFGLGTQPSYKPFTSKE